MTGPTSSLWLQGPVEAGRPSNSWEEWSHRSSCFDIVRHIDAEDAQAGRRKGHGHVNEILEGSERSALGGVDEGRALSVPSASVEPGTDAGEVPDELRPGNPEELHHENDTVLDAAEFVENQVGPEPGAQKLERASCPTRPCSVGLPRRETWLSLQTPPFLLPRPLRSGAPVPTPSDSDGAWMCISARDRSVTGRRAAISFKERERCLARLDTASFVRPSTGELNQIHPALKTRAQHLLSAENRVRPETVPFPSPPES